MKRKRLCILLFCFVFLSGAISFGTNASAASGDLLTGDQEGWVLSHGYGVSVKKVGDYMNDGKITLDASNAAVILYYFGENGPKDGQSIKFTIRMIEPRQWISFFFRTKADESIAPKNVSLWKDKVRTYTFFFWGDTHGSRLSVGVWENEVEENRNKTVIDNADNPLLYDNDEHTVEIMTKNEKDGVRICVLVDGQDAFYVFDGHIDDEYNFNEETGRFGFQIYHDAEMSGSVIEVSNITVQDAVFPERPTTTERVTEPPTAAPPTEETDTAAPEPIQGPENNDPDGGGPAWPVILGAAGGAAVILGAAVFFILKQKKKQG